MSTTLADLEAQATRLGIYTDDRDVYMEAGEHWWLRTLERRIDTEEWCREVARCAGWAGPPLGGMSVTDGEVSL